MTRTADFSTASPWRSPPAPVRSTPPPSSTSFRDASASRSTTARSTCSSPASWRPALPTLIFYRVTGGSFLPTTFAVKSGLPGDLLPSGRYLRTVVGIFFDCQPVAFLIAGAGVLRLVEDRRVGFLPALWPVGLAFAYSLLAPASGPIVVGNFGRYYFPLLPVIAVLGVLGLERAAGALREASGRPAFAARWALVAALLVPQLWGLYRGPMRYLQTVGNVEDSDVAAARWLAGRLDPEAVLAVQDIGALKYFLPNPIVDLTGIVNPDVVPVLKAARPIYWEERLRRYLEERRPDYLVVFPSSYPRLTGQTPGFQKVRSFPVPNNVTMAGDELAVFTTPWTRDAYRSLLASSPAPGPSNRRPAGLP